MVKFKINWSVEARLDLIDILEFYNQRNGSSAYSIKLNSRIKDSLKLIAKNPLIGMQTDYPNVRTMITGDYQIIYEMIDMTILIVMLWDSRRDPDDKLIFKNNPAPPAR